MKKLKAINALLVETKRNKKGGFAKIKFQLTAAVTKALDWPDMPEGTAEWTPDVDTLQARTLELTPNDITQKAHAVTMDITSIGDFMIQRKKKKSGKNSVKADKVITEVVCNVKFSAETGCAMLEQYILSAGRSEMLLVYEPAPVQGELEGTRVDMSPIDGRQSVIPEVEATEEQRAVVTEIDPNAEYVERAKERMAAKKKAKVS